MAAAASRSTLKVPTRVTMTGFTNASKSCGSPARPTVRWAQPMPAQLIAMRSGRSLSVASAIAACTDASSVTSVRTKVVCPPNSAARAAPRSSWRSRIVTAAPLAARARVVASPSPEAPPETTAATSKLVMPRKLSRAVSVGAGSPWLVRMREPDRLRVEPAYHPLALGLRLVQLAEPHCRVAGDDDRTSAGLDDHHLRTGRVTWCREESDSRKQLELAVDRHVPDSGSLDPL